MPSAPSQQNHLVFLSCAFQGHGRPLTSTVCNLLRLHPGLHITLVTSPLGDALVRATAKQHYDEHSASRLRIVCAMVAARPGHEWVDGERALEQRADRGKGSWHEVLVALLQGKTEIFVRNSGKVEDGFCGIEPSALVADWFLFLQNEIWLSAQKAAGVVDRLPYLIHFPGPVGGVLYQHCPSVGACPFPLMRAEANRTLRDNGRFSADASDEEILLSPEFEAMGEKMYFDVPDQLLTDGGGPPAWSYEYTPQAENLKSDSKDTIYGWMEGLGNVLMNHCDGIITPWTSSLLEPDALIEARRLLPSLIDWYPIGSQGPTSLWDKTPSPLEGRSDADREVLAFLDKMRTDVGEKRTVFVSFGSLFWPVRTPHHVTIMLETLLELGVPFVFAKAAFYAGPLDEELELRIKASGRGLVVPWAPQYDVLSHPATGWFVSHGGSNSTSESLICGVPMIHWPFTTDQPVIASQFSVKLKLSFELLQVRNGPSVGKPTARGPVVLGTDEAIKEEMCDVFGKLDGPEGLKIRRNVEQMSAAMRVERAEGGSAWREMQRLGMVGLKV